MLSTRCVKPRLINLLVLLLLTACQLTPVYSSTGPIFANFQVEPSLTPSYPSAAGSTTTFTATATNIGQPTASPTAVSTQTPTASANITSDPTATQTTTPSSTPETTVMVSGYSVNLRTSPGTHFAVVRKLDFGELLTPLGRSSDNTWLYVKTADDQVGWIHTAWVDLAGINLDDDDYPVQTPSPAPETTIKVFGASVNLRTGPSIDFEKVRRLDFGEPLMLLGRLSDNSWFYVKTADNLEGWIHTTWVDLAGMNLNDADHPVKTPPPTPTSTPVILVGIEGHWIDIDLSEQKLYAYDGTELVASFLVSTGIDLYPTERGRYHIDAKLLYSDMRGTDYFLPDVPFTMYYHGDFAIHGTYWHHSFGTPMSHGCVNMDVSDAEWLFNWSSVGTLVNIHR